jgi:hypothetical protein
MPLFTGWLGWLYDFVVMKEIQEMGEGVILYQYCHCLTGVWISCWTESCDVLLMLYPCSGPVRKELVERCMFLGITRELVGQK